MSNIDNYSVEELRDALKRKEKMNSIKPLENPDFSKLKESVINAVEAHIKTGEEEKNIEHYIYEESLKAIYGSDIFDKLYRQ